MKEEQLLARFTNNRCGLTKINYKEIELIADKAIELIFSNVYNFSLNILEN